MSVENSCGPWNSCDLWDFCDWEGFVIRVACVARSAKKIRSFRAEHSSPNSCLLNTADNLTRQPRHSDVTSVTWTVVTSYMDHITRVLL